MAFVVDLNEQIFSRLTVFRAGKISRISSDGGTSRIDRNRCVTFRFKIPARRKRARINWPHRNFAYFKTKYKMSEKGHENQLENLTFMFAHDKHYIF